MDSRLDALSVLVLDSQTTGSSPRKASLLEIGWMVVRASDSVPAVVDSHLVLPPDKAAIPFAVTRVTGIDTASLAGAMRPRQVWQRLEACATATAAAAGLDKCPTIIHFARFETPFLRELHDRFAPTRIFPCQVICTHEIARRLFPGLPRKGLRAVAGFLGHSVDSRRRCAPHVQATAVIWQQMVPLLRRRHSIDSWEKLRAWVANTPVEHRPARSYPLKPQIRQQVPDQPGIYRMRRSNGDLLYVGKATSLKMRVNSYFRPKARHAEHTLEMLSQARRLDVTPTVTALEAAVLESDQIKDYEPPYNKALRKAERRLAYCSRDLSRWTTGAAKDGWVGPFPSQRKVESLTALASWWSAPGRVPADDGLAILNLPPSYQPPRDCAREGLELFYRAHAAIVDGRPPLRAIASLGAAFWQERLDAAAQEQVQDPNLQDQEEASAPEAGERLWTPEAVQRSIEHIIRHAAHMLRRVRWFCLLSESNLLWETRADGESQRLAKIRMGRLVAGHDHAIDKSPPGPNIDHRPLAVRRQALDIVAYDRLRVITTEIRRLVHDNRRPVVCLANGRNLASDQLRQLLKWV